MQMPIEFPKLEIFNASWGTDSISQEPNVNVHWYKKKKFTIGAIWILQ